MVRPAVASFLLSFVAASAYAQTEDMEPHVHAPFVVSSSGSAPAVAQNGQVALVVWEDSRHPETAPDLYAARIRLADGAVLDPGGFPLHVAPGRDVRVDVASDGLGFLVAWEKSSALHQSDIWTVTVDGGGVAGTAQVVGDLARRDTEVSLAGDATGYFAVWHSWWVDDSDAEVFIVDLATDGTPASAIRSARMSGNPFFFTAATDAIDDFVLGYQHELCGGITRSALDRWYSHCFWEDSRGIALARSGADVLAAITSLNDDSDYTWHYVRAVILERGGWTAEPAEIVARGATGFASLSASGLGNGAVALAVTRETRTAPLRAVLLWPALGVSAYGATPLPLTAESLDVVGVRDRTALVAMTAGGVRAAFLDFGDGVATASDNCPQFWNPDQADSDGDGTGNACLDEDHDGWADNFDNCPGAANPEQRDLDRDGIGGPCDPDDDSDGVDDLVDNCPSVANYRQYDLDSDGEGDRCDDDLDGDGVLNADDNCRRVPNPGNEDVDGDGIGDACEDLPEDSDVPEGPGPGDARHDVPELPRVSLEEASPGSGRGCSVAQTHSSLSRAVVLIGLIGGALLLVAGRRIA